MVDHFCLQYYLKKGIPELLRNWITKIRLSGHNLAIESGRFTGITRLNRLCIFCGDDIEDEFHFVLKCKTFQGFRNCLIKPYYWQKPSMYKFIQLLSSNNIRQLCNPRKYLFRSFKLRDELIVYA